MQEFESGLSAGGVSPTIVNAPPPLIEMAPAALQLIDVVSIDHGVVLPS